MGRIRKGSRRIGLREGGERGGEKGGENKEGE